MRSIKFRRWNGREFGYFSDGEYDEVFEWCEAQQFTGLVDKQGVEIYEGDIITAGSGLNDKFKVEYKINSFIFRIAYYKYTRYLLYLEKWQYSELEVIGNIYENPELLEDK